MRREKGGKKFGGEKEEKRIGHNIFPSPDRRLTLYYPLGGGGGRKGTKGAG